MLTSILEARKAVLTPWGDDVLKAAQALCNEVQVRPSSLYLNYFMTHLMHILLSKQKRRTELATSNPGRAGKKGPGGRMDYRSVAQEFPPICIDNRRASFFDDAFSLSPETGELLIHIVDVREYLR